MAVRRRPAQLGTLLATLVLAAGCGGTDPEPLTVMKPEVPADLCALIPEAARAGLVANSSSDDTANPTAACSLRSPDAASTEVRAIVTWLQAGDEISADEVQKSQCLAIDRTEFRDRAGFKAAGAEESCAATANGDGADSATIAVVNGLEVVTVRLTSVPAAGAPALTRAQQMIEGVLSSLAGDS